MTRRWQKPRTSAVDAVVFAAYASHGAMTISECARATGIHSERIRRVVKAPQFERVALAGKAAVWRLRRTE